MNLEALKAYKDKATTRKGELEALKAKGGKSWTADLQTELSSVTLSLVDVDSVIKDKEGEYKPAPGTEKMVHLSIVRGRRFNPNTGKEESPTYTQMFTYAEWQLFKEAHRGLGYLIMKVLWDPYNEAKAYEYKEPEDKK